MSSAQLRFLSGLKALHNNILPPLCGAFRATLMDSRNGTHLNFHFFCRAERRRLMEFVYSCRLSLQHLVWVFASLSCCLRRQTVLTVALNAPWAVSPALRDAPRLHMEHKLIYLPYKGVFLLNKNWIFFSCIFLDAYENTWKAQKTEAFGRNPGWHAAVLHSCVRMKAPNSPNFLSTPRERGSAPDNDVNASHPTAGN